MSKVATALLAALAVAGPGILASAAASGSAEDSGARPGGTLRLVHVQDLATDPQNGLVPILDATQLTLYAYIRRAGEKTIVPAAAAGPPRISAGGRTYTIAVRPGFRFSDGKAVTARNFGYAINRLFNPELHSTWAYLFDDIVGARAVLGGTAKTVVGVSVRGNRLTVRLEEPRLDFLARLTNPTISATPLDMPVVAGGIRTPVPSAGPYVLREHVPGRRAVFARNPFWRRARIPWQPANVDRIVFERPGLSQRAALDAVERNEIDLALAQGSGRVPELVRRHGVNRGRLLVRPRLTVFSLLFNNSRPLFGNNPKLRRAVSYALDRPRLALAVEPLQRVTDQILPPGLPGYSDWRLYPLDGPSVAKARALARGSLRGAKAVFYARDPASQEPFQVRVAHGITRDLARIGLDVEVRTFPDLNRRLRTPGEPWDLALHGWFADYPDPQNVIGELFDGRNVPSGATGGSNLSRFDSRAFNRRIRRAALLSGRERLAAYARIERDLLRDAAPVAPILLVTDVILVSRSLGCFTYHPMGFVSLASVCKR